MSQVASHQPSPPAPRSPRARGGAAAVSRCSVAADPGARLGAALRDLARERPITMTVRGDCMAPRLREGYQVEVAPARRYWPGDIVAFQTPQGRIALHRLLGYRLLAGRLACVTRGDHCGVPDAPLAPERLLGRAAVPPTLADRARAVAALLALALRGARRRLSG